LPSDKDAPVNIEADSGEIDQATGTTIYQGDVILGRLSMGTDYLNPAACVELHATSTAGSAF